MAGALLGIVTRLQVFVVELQGGLISNQPDVPEWIDEPTLAMPSPRRRVVSDWIDTAIRTGLQCLRKEGIRVLTEYFDAGSRATEFGRAFPPIPLRLADKEWGTRHFKTSHRAEIPQHDGTKGALVPCDGRRHV